MSAYTATELDILRKPPVATGLAISMADGGLFSTTIQFSAMLRKVKGATKEYPANSIIQAAFSNESSYSTPETKSKHVQSDDLVDQAIERIDAALTIVADKANDTEIAEYKQFIYDCGVIAVEAVSKGPFGRGRENVSETAAAALAKIKDALGI